MFAVNKMKNTKLKQIGFTLLEMLLVLVIMSSILGLLINISTHKVDQLKRDKAALQMQQIMNAALTFYISNGRWPVNNGTCPSGNNQGETLNNTQALQTGGYLPAASTNNPWGGAYFLNCNTTNGVNFFTVTTNAVTVANATTLAGSLPIATRVAAGDTNFPGGTFVTSQVTVPGQNLNNARSVNFAGVYHSGACVPTPTCPPGMIPDIVASPMSIAGVTDAPTGCNNANPPVCSNPVAYPISAFQISVQGPAEATDIDGPPMCDGSGNLAPCYSDIATGSNAWVKLTTGTYWRVCLRVYTSNGEVIVDSTGSNAPGVSSNASSIYWASIMGSVAVQTRCVPNGEAGGSRINVWGN
jgi:general secretion pathway protein G